MRQWNRFSASRGSGASGWLPTLPVPTTKRPRRSLRRGRMSLGTDVTNPSLKREERASSRRQRRRRRASLAVVLVAVERVALAEAGDRPYLAALAILPGQEFADLADGAFVGRGAPAAVFAVFGGVEILIALAMIRPHPGAPGALGRNQRAVLGLRLGTLGGHHVQALALVALIAVVAIVAAIAVAAVI